jgi:hypothetical protein
LSRVCLANARAELLQADVLPADLAHLVIGCMRSHGGASLGVVGDIVRTGDMPGGDAWRACGRAAALAVARRSRHAWGR